MIVTGLNVAGYESASENGEIFTIVLYALTAVIQDVTAFLGPVLSLLVLLAHVGEMLPTYATQKDRNVQKSKIQFGE